MIKAIKAAWFAWRASALQQEISFLEGSRRMALHEIDNKQRERERVLTKLEMCR